MKKILMFLVACCISVCMHAQAKNDSVVLRVSYASHMRYTEDRPKLREDEKILDIGHYSSHFYSRWAERNNDISDSIFSKGGSYEEYMAVKQKIGMPTSSTPLNVFKNYPQKGVLTYTDKMIKNFLYEEKMEAPQWNLLEGDTTIVGYKCNRASATFRGRTWTVWYAIDIPYGDGPWKLYGLPGLILYAKDSKGDFIFDCIWLKNGDGQPIALRHQKYIKCTAEEMENNYRQSAGDSDFFLAKMGISGVKGFSANGKPIVHTSRIPCLLEYVLKTDKK